MTEICSEISGIIDARGLVCPMPLLKLKLALAQQKGNQSIKLLVTDPGSVRDIPLYLQKLGHAFNCQHLHDGAVLFEVA